MAYKQDVYFATEEDAATGGIGTGTASDPFRGDPDDNTWFDLKIAGVPPSTTVRLGPGIFQTRGNAWDSSGLVARSGMRLLGSGLAATTLKLANVSQGDRAVIGMQTAAQSALEGFEASDFTIDCNFSVVTPPNNAVTPGVANRAIFVFGTHIYLHDLRIVNFGGTDSVAMTVVVPASSFSDDCVVEGCTIAAPSHTGASPCIFVGFGGNWEHPNRNCVLRNCFCRGPGTGDIPDLFSALYGVAPRGASGFIVEGNHFVNLISGVYDAPNTETSVDILVRHNHFRNVSKGINYSYRTWPLHRMIVHDNVFDVSTYFPGATAIALLGTSGSTVYTALIVRKNIIRHLKWDTAPENITGIDVSWAKDLNVQFNTINNTTTGTGVRTANVQFPTVTPNLNTSGRARPEP